MAYPLLHLTLLVADTCDLPAAINWLFHVSAAAPSVVVPSLLLVLQSGIHCLTICAIQLLGQTSFNGIWNPPQRLRGEVLTTRRYTNRPPSPSSPVCLLLAFCWLCIRGVFYVFGLYKCTFTYLLTYLLTVLDGVGLGLQRFFKPCWAAASTRRTFHDTVLSVICCVFFHLPVNQP